LILSAGIDQTGNYNPKNLFTQSAFSNQKIQTIFEGKILAALRQKKRVIYQATPIFRAKELMAQGIIYKQFQQMKLLILTFICSIFSLNFLLITIPVIIK